MRLVWTKSNLIFSRLERWALKAPVSHFLLVFNDDLVFQSNMRGTGLDYYPNTLRHLSSVYEVVIPLPEETEDNVYRTIMNKFDGVPYGWRAWVYFCYRGLLFRLFNIPLPVVNPWAQKGTYLCVGLSKGLDTEGVPLWLRECVKDIPDAEMITPFGLYLKIKNAIPS